MKRLVMMWGYQILFTSVAGAFLGAAMFTVMSWTMTKAVLLGVLPLLILVGTGVGYVSGRSNSANANDPPVQRALRGLVGSVLGMMVFSPVALSLGVLALYAYGLLGNEGWFSLLEDWFPAMCTAGGGVGLVAGYRMAH